MPMGKEIIGIPGKKKEKTKKKNKKKMIKEIEIDSETIIEMIIRRKNHK